MRPEIHDADDTDFARFFKTQAPATRWRGKCIRKGDLVKAMAGVVLSDDGRYFAFMELRGAGRFPLVFRRVLRFLENTIEDFEIDEVFAFCDDRYPRAHQFIERLGFVKTEEEHDQGKVWRWRASEQ